MGRRGQRRRSTLRSSGGKKWWDGTVGELEGHNTVVRSRDPSAGGEVQVVAIRNACKNLNTEDLAGCELYTSCEPCAMCTYSSLIWLCHFDMVYYANSLQDTLKYCCMCQGVGLEVEKRSTLLKRCVQTKHTKFSSAGGNRKDDSLTQEIQAKECLFLTNRMPVILH